MVFSISRIYSSASILTCLAIAYLLPPPYMPESRQFQESHCVIGLNNTKKVYNVIYNVYKVGVWIFNGLFIKEL